MTVDNSDL